MGKEQSPAFYTGKNYDKPEVIALYKPIYTKVLEYLRVDSLNLTVVDLGCGVGFLAQELQALNYTKYLGIDFSETMITKAKKRVPKFTFMLGNLLEPKIQDLFKKYSTFVLLEVLEHVEKDLTLLKSIPVGSSVIFSVPNFDSRGHVRFFKNSAEVITRYEQFLDFSSERTVIKFSQRTKAFLFNTRRGKND